MHAGFRILQSLSLGYNKSHIFISYFSLMEQLRIGSASRTYFGIDGLADDLQAAVMHGMQ